jgi:hypothetical protein
MTEQLELLAPAPPKLTERQQLALDHLEHAGPDGLAADHIGALLHQTKPAGTRGHHTAETRCLYCGKTGREVLEALKAKGLARYRRARGDTPGAWVTSDQPATPPRAVRGMLPDSEAIPF